MASQTRWVSRAAWGQVEFIVPEWTASQKFSTMRISCTHPGKSRCVDFPLPSWSQYRAFVTS